MDFSNYLFRCSQLSKITGGTIGLTDIQKNELSTLQKRKMDAALGDVDEKGKAVKPLTDNMELRLEELLSVSKNPELPKTMQTELKGIYLMVKHNRQFTLMNRYIAKGIINEEEAITLLQNNLNREKTTVLFTKNKETFKNEYITGTPDLIPKKINGKKVGFDVKSSWNIKTFPLDSDDIIGDYYWQNVGYMWLTGADEWVTSHCLVNIHEHGLQTEKMKFYYAYGCPSSPDDINYTEYIEECRKLERELIFDYDRFVENWPVHDMCYSRDEWHSTVNPWTGNVGLDIDAKERVVHKKVCLEKNDIDFIIERILIARKFLQEHHERSLEGHTGI